MPKAPVPVVEGLVVAGVFARIVAYLTDLLLLGAVNLVVLGLLGYVTTGPDDTVSILVRGVLVGVDFLYFVGLWSSGMQATLGMRLLKLRILGAATAQTIPANDALLRWLALTGAVSILSVVPNLETQVSLLNLLWVLALLVTTASNRLHQGLHDRWARSVVVQPASAGSGAAIATCLLLLGLVFVVLPIALLVLYGDQFRDLLLRIGESI